MEQIVVAIIGGIVAIVVAIISVWNKSKQSDKKPENSPVSTQQLIETLNSTVEAQNKQIEILRGVVDEQRLELAERERELEDLRKRVSNLEQLTVQQALLIDALEKSKGRVRREPKTTEGGEA